jgi:hypothetical protein
MKPASTRTSARGTEYETLIKKTAARRSGEDAGARQELAELRALKKELAEAD